MERSALIHVPTPAPTDTWHPIAHWELVQQIESSLGKFNMRVVEQAHSLTKEGNRYFGLLQVANCQQAGKDFGYVLGIRNSHDKSFSAGLVVGSQVFVCGNLSFSGEIKISRKHTSRIMEDLPRLTGNAVGLLSEKWTAMGERIERYKATEIDDKICHDMIIRAVDLNAAKLTTVPAILKEWRKPRHEEFAPRTVWSLFNAFTEVAKETSLSSLPKRTITLHGLCDAQAGIKS